MKEIIENKTLDKIEWRQGKYIYSRLYLDSNLFGTKALLLCCN